MNAKPTLSSFALFLLLAARQAPGAEAPKAPVPQSPFIRVVYGYTDAMVKNGRDNYGPQKTGLFLSALDCAAMTPLTNLPVAPKGVRSGDRAGSASGPLVGANPQHDENFLRLLYTLSELSGKPHYRAAADAELKWFLENAGSTNTGLLPWGEHTSWDVMRDQPIASNRVQIGTDAVFRPWMLWDRCFELAPDASKGLAMVLRQPPTDSMDFPRRAGFYLRAWAVTYARTKDEQF